MNKVAILVDGNFYLRRHHAHFGAERASKPKIVARDMWNHCIKHIKNDDKLYRILFYDCPPVEKRVHHPLSNRSIVMGKTNLAVFRNQLFQEIVKRPNVALRLGYLDEDNARWRIRDPKLHQKVITGKVTADSLSESDYIYHAPQKGVDMKIGLDIASLALKNMVDRIILVAGDSDFVPAAKMARREGIQFILDPMRNPIKPDLSEHIDGLRTTLPRSEARAT